MSEPPPLTTEPPPSVFLSYASEDRPAVRRLRDALGAAGLDVWYDENELTGGESWDRKIRRQIRECTYFMPVVSASSNARAEGYFRREWRLAVERTQDLADDVIFLLPVAIDGTDESTARVPDAFLNVQWLRAPEGEPTPALLELAQRLLAGGSHQLHRPPAPRSAPPRRAKNPAPVTAHDEPPHPPWFRQVQRYWRMMPRWVQICLWVILLITLLGKCAGGGDNSDAKERRQREERALLGNNKPERPPPAKKPQVASDEDLEAIKRNVGEALRDVLQNVATDANDDKSAKPGPVLLAVPFAAENDKQSEFSSRVLTLLWGRVVLLRPGRVDLSATPLTGAEGDTTPLERAKAKHARFLLTGREAAGTLRVELRAVASGDLVWHGDYPTDRPVMEVAQEIFQGIRSSLAPKR
jgi:hypothetical protein